MIRMTLIAGLVALAVACGGDDGSGDGGRVLHFPGQDVSEENYRAFLRATSSDNLIAWGLLCNDLDGLSDDAALNYFRNSNSDDTIPEIAGAIPKPGQESDDESMMRAVQIVRSECER